VITSMLCNCFGGGRRVGKCSENKAAAPRQVKSTNRTSPSERPRQLLRGRGGCEWTGFFSSPPASVWGEGLSSSPDHTLKSPFPCKKKKAGDASCTPVTISCSDASSPPSR
jgi:hypothetical protein